VVDSPIGLRLTGPPISCLIIAKRSLLGSLFSDRWSERPVAGTVQPYL